MKVILAHVMARLIPTLRIPNGVNPHFLSRDPEVVKAYQADPLIHRMLTARCAVALQHAIRKAQEIPNRLKIPCLVLQAGLDRICNPEAAARFAQAVPHRLATFRRYENLHHELFNEPERAQVMEDLFRWIEGVLR